MANPLHHSAEYDAREAALSEQVDMLIRHLDRAYVTAGQPGVLSLVREMLRAMSPAALTALVYRWGLETEPGQEAEPGEPHPTAPE